MQNLLKMFKEGSLSDTLENVGKVATIFNPMFGSGLILASKLTDGLTDVSDDFLENDVIGLKGSAVMLDKMIASQSIDYDKLEMISTNLKSMSVFVEKSAKLVK